MSKQEVIQYQPQGTCCRAMQIVVEDGKIVDADFMGGCNGNLKGIKSLIKGMEIDDVIERLNGIQCGGKTTSCPDQLACCLKQYKESKTAVAN
ncbi:MAG TPA: TIGR03905 family TSCPD domain-containing protein [Cyanobacteria bacterium UBA11991]|nr:TIGR03905 family TSCPD domain-containing protein [Cyanobacteriota bacterium]MDY6359453.1 TIGR03905 family TSCPD domain-containing protein [Cyanobacteriota bacterium]MDY6363427.1 TIGR03905 family TSCPD domain-containing protein [Cyanobacteriota bacterium]MDY6382526.1 TIGR03905 family TSCPD domain-containing protein [Cyanobacteriota bacterium]HCB11352.1 TIGR03905 family TSCPD domain-containing protein [Cyanobacteria bacterium UBA11991]